MFLKLFTFYFKNIEKINFYKFFNYLINVYLFNILLIYLTFLNLKFNNSINF